MHFHRSCQAVIPKCLEKLSVTREGAGPFPFVLTALVTGAAPRAHPRPHRPPALTLFLAAPVTRGAPCRPACVSRISCARSLGACPFGGRLCHRPTNGLLFSPLQDSCARVLLFRGGNKELKNYNSQTPFQVRGAPRAAPPVRAPSREATRFPHGPVCPVARLAGTLPGSEPAPPSRRSRWRLSVCRSAALLPGGQSGGSPQPFTPVGVRTASAGRLQGGRFVALPWGGGLPSSGTPTGPAVPERREATPARRWPQGSGAEGKATTSSWLNCAGMYHTKSAVLTVSKGAFQGP